MAFLYDDISAASDYGLRTWKRQGRDPQEYFDKIATSTTIYVGNLSFWTTEEQIWELFMKVGEVKRIIMGLNANDKTPCGFCFVDYFTHEAAMDCVNVISGTRLDDRIIRADWDTGFEEGRQYGRGKSGGQIRDDYRTDFDPERGGAGRGVGFNVERFFDGSERRDRGGRGRNLNERGPRGGHDDYRDDHRSRESPNKGFRHDRGGGSQRYDDRRREFDGPQRGEHDSRDSRDNDKDRYRERDRDQDRDRRDRDRSHRDRDFSDHRDREHRDRRDSRAEDESRRLKDAFGRDIPQSHAREKRDRDDSDSGMEPESKRQKLE